MLEKIEQSEERACERDVSDDETYAKMSMRVNNNGDTSEKVLGMSWDCESDKFIFCLRKLAERAKSVVATKRNILSILASLFDPLGIISPVAVSIKMLFQELCLDKVEWDEELEGERKKLWLSWVEHLERANQIVVSRCIYGSLIGKTTCFLHGFADASLKAYCAVIYFVTELNGGYHVELLTSKTRIAPMKAQTIPRLELMSAKILAKLMSTVKEALEHSVQFSGVYYWLDSKTALCWINNQGEWKQFVRHRVNEILKLSRKKDWSHCPGVENPADLGSRGVTASCLNESELWWKGPKWLSGPTCSWPATEEILETDECLTEVKKTVVMKTQVEETFRLENVININAYSKIEKLIRVIALVKRFINNLKVIIEGRMAALGTLKVEETMMAECTLIKAAQASLKSRSDYQQLVSQLGIVERNGVLRCKGRLSDADLEIEAREPMILPKEHYLTELIIRDSHNRIHHCGLRATLAELRSRFWVPKGRQVVKRVIGSCLVCKKHNGKAYGTPAQADLPEFRVQQSPPFSKVGVDFAGPLFAKEGSDMVKVYIALFTCCVTRAVHLDLVSNLSAPCFLNCLRRFTSRRGAPTLIVSDNAKTFKAAHKAVQSLYNSKEVKSYLESC